MNNNVQKNESHLPVLQFDLMPPIEVGCNNFYDDMPYLLYCEDHENVLVEVIEIVHSHAALVHPDVHCQIRENYVRMNKYQVSVGHSHQEVDFFMDFIRLE